MKILQALLLSTTAVYAAASFALPALQLGGDGSSSWSYDTGSETWIVSDTNSFSLTAFANCEDFTGCNGRYAWETGNTDRYAYLTVAATPNVGIVDAFDITVLGATLVDMGYGTPPESDSNSLAPHGIYGTYYEIYEFQFDGSLVDIYDTQPGESGTGLGYTESLGITINDVVAGLEGIHFDLFTFDDYEQVYTFAPFSHDAEWKVPEPGVLALLGIGLIGLGLRKLKNN